MFYLIGLGIDAVLLIVLIISYKNKKRNEECVCENCRYLKRKYKTGRTYKYECNNSTWTWTFDKDRYPVVCSYYKDKSNTKQENSEEEKSFIKQSSENYNKELAFLNSQTPNLLAYQAALNDSRTQLNMVHALEDLRTQLNVIKRM